MKSVHFLQVKKIERRLLIVLTFVVPLIGVSVDTPDAEHMTALHLAVQRGLVEVISLLLEAGARVNNKMNDKVHIEAL